MKTSPLLLFQLLIILSLNKTFAVSSQSLTTPGAPSILVGPVSELTGTSVELWASITTNGSSTVAWFEWGKTPALGNATPRRGAIAPLPYFQIQGELLKDLELATTYYYRAVAMNEYGLNHDTVRTFTTLPGLRRPDLVILEADSVTETSVRMRAQCRPNGSYTWIYFV